MIPQHNVRFSCDASLANSIYWNEGKTRTISKFSFFNYTTVVYVHLCEFTAKFHCLQYGYFAVVTFTTPRLPRRSGIMSCAFAIEYALAMEFPLSWKINWISKYCCCWCSQVSSNIPWWYILRKKHVVWLIDWWIFCCSHCTAFAFEKLAAPTQTKWVRWEEIERKEKWFVACIGITYIIEMTTAWVWVWEQKKSSQLVSMHEQMMLKTDECRLEPFTSWMTIHAISNSSSFFALSSMRQCTFVVKNAKERVQTRDAMISARKEGNVLTWIHVRGTLVLCVRCTCEKGFQHLHIIMMMNTLSILDRSVWIILLWN